MSRTEPTAASGAIAATVTPTPAAACMMSPLLAFPELAPLVDLHLADSDTGEPMHAEANALYFYLTARGLPGGWSDDHQHAEREGLTVEGYARRVACSILRADEIPLDDVPEHDLAAAFHQFVEDQRERWQDEARAGREQLQAIPTIYRAPRLRRSRERDRAPQLSQLHSVLTVLLRCPRRHTLTSRSQRA